MKRTGLIITILVVVALFFVQHRSTPNVALPTTAKMVGTAVRIPVRMQLPNPTEESFTLATQQYKTYFVNVYNKGQLVKQFESTSRTNDGQSGETFATSGNIMFNSYLYQGAIIHINADQKSGYIQLTPAKSGS